MTKSTEKNFEKDLSTLEEIVEQIEEGKLTLDVSLKRFEEGIKLYKDLKSSLDSAEKKIKILTDDLKEKDL